MRLRGGWGIHVEMCIYWSGTREGARAKQARVSSPRQHHETARSWNNPPLRTNSAQAFKTMAQCLM